MIKSIRQSSKQIRTVTFFHQRMLGNKKEQELNASMALNYQNVSEEKMFYMKNNFMLELKQLQLWKTNLFSSFIFSYVWSKCILYVQNMHNNGNVFALYWSGTIVQYNVYHLFISIQEIAQNAYAMNLLYKMRNWIYVLWKWLFKPFDIFCGYSYYLISYMNCHRSI